MTRRPLHFALFLLTAAALSARAQVQLEAPAQIHSPQVTLHRKAHAEDVSWMFGYLDPPPAGNEARLATDPQFETFLKRHLLAPQSFWAGGAKPLREVAGQFLSGNEGMVRLADNRYLSVSAAVPEFQPNRGLLWIDTGLSDPLVVFAAIDWVNENRATDDKAATFAMWVFPSRALDPHHLPPALVRGIGQWSVDLGTGGTAAHVQEITRVFLVDPDGTPHPVTPSTIGVRSTMAAETQTDPGAQSVGHTNTDQGKTEQSKTGQSDAAATTNRKANP